MGAPRSGRRGPRKRTVEEPQGDGRYWPLLREQLMLRTHIPDAERRAAEQRAQVLVSWGYGALEAWLNHEGQHPGEEASAPPDQEPIGRKFANLADLFDVAA